MYLKRIEITGFKSFAEPVELEFGSGLTAVVGPNGSGKSNLVEAIRWALGEPSARQLRGERLEDYLWNGNSQLRPGGMAEVSLVLAGEEGEERFTRRYFRTGESEYLLNGRIVRRKDLARVGLALGLGIEGYFFVSQGRVGEILNQTAEERRTFLEEAAGVTVLRQRQGEIERELRETGVAIGRLEDLLGEVGSRLEPLRAEVSRLEAEEQLEAEIRELALGIEVSAQAGLKREWETAERRRTAAVSRHTELERNLQLLAAAAVPLDGLRLRGREDLSRWTAVSRRWEAQAAAWREERIRSEERGRYLAELAARAEDEWSRAATEVSRLRASVEEEREREVAVREGEARLAGAEESLAAEIFGFEAEIGELGEEGQALGEVPSPEQLLAWGEERERLAADRVEVSRRQAEAAERHLNLGSERAGVAAAVSAAEEDLAALRRERQQHRSLWESEAQAQRVQARRLAEVQAERQTRAAAYRRLVRADRALDGYPAPIRDILLSGRDGRLTGILGTVHDLLAVEPVHRPAIQAALGGSQLNVVVTDEEALKGALAFLRAGGRGRGTFLALSLLRPRPPVRLSPRPGLVGTAVDFCRYPETIRPAAEYLLGRILVAQDLDAALSLGRGLETGQRLVTLDGQLVQNGGPVTGGSAPVRTAPAERQQERERLLAELREMGEKLRQERSAGAAIERRLAGLAEGLENLAATEAAGRERLEELRLESRRRATEEAEREREASRLATEGQRLERLVADLGARLAGGEEQYRLARQRAAAATVRKERRRELEERLREGLGRLAEIRVRRETLSEEGRRLGVNLAGMVATAAAATNALAELAGRRAALEAQQADLQSQEERLREREPDLAEGLRRARTLETERQGLSRVLESLAGRLEARASVGRRERERAGREGSEAELEVARLSAELASRERSAREMYGWQESENLRPLPPRPEEVLAERRRELQELGPVNRGARREYQEVAERHGFLQRQAGDLRGAKDGLSSLVGEMTAHRDRAFAETTRRVSQELGDIFGRFFPGGRAVLVAGPAGVELEAALPGKRPVRLGLLSGGERTLTALAFLLALLAVRPSPFYLLDEVEAALDEANVVRLARYLRELSGRQLIVVTHQRPTMEAAHQVYGVTTGPKGQSQTVTVRLRSDEAPGGASVGHTNVEGVG